MIEQGPPLRGVEPEHAVEDRAGDQRRRDERERGVLGATHGTARATAGSGRRSF